MRREESKAKADKLQEELAALRAHLQLVAGDGPEQERMMQRLMASSVADIGRPRFALIIGNGAYKSSPLTNPVKDANDMAARLRGPCGFHSVMMMMNLTKAEIKQAIANFEAVINTPVYLK